MNALNLILNTRIYQHQDEANRLYSTQHLFVSHEHEVPSVDQSSHAR